LRGKIIENKRLSGKSNAIREIPAIVEFKRLSGASLILLDLGPEKRKKPGYDAAGLFVSLFLL
jgi:hypothetical protein